MEFEHLLSRLALALGIGLLIGVERGWRTREAEPGSRTAGIRTFAISGLLGGTIGAIAQAAGGAMNVAGGIVVAVGFGAYVAAITVFCREENRAEGTFSATTAIAAMLTFALGTYALLGDERLAAAAGVAATVFLATRDELHESVAKITWPELRSGLVLLAMTFIALPVIPHEPIGPFGGVNPREVWIIAIVLASVSFVGYAAVRILGTSRGVLVAAAAGGLVSSTAVTLANARRAAGREGPPRLLAAGVCVATAISFMRVFAIGAVLEPRLLVVIGPALVAAAAGAIAFAVLLALRQARAAKEQKDIAFRNPFGFWSTVGLAASLGAIIVLGRAVGEAFGATGALVGAIVVGLVDVDSVTVSLARLLPAPLSVSQAAFAILAAVASDTLSKVAIGAVIGRGWFVAQLGIMAGICLGAGMAALALSLALAQI